MIILGAKWDQITSHLRITSECDVIGGEVCREGSVILGTYYTNYNLEGDDQRNFVKGWFCWFMTCRHALWQFYYVHVVHQNCPPSRFFQPGINIPLPKYQFIGGKVCMQMSSRAKFLSHLFSHLAPHLHRHHDLNTYFVVWLDTKIRVCFLPTFTPGMIKRRAESRPRHATRLISHPSIHSTTVSTCLTFTQYSPRKGPTETGQSWDKSEEELRRDFIEKKFILVEFRKLFKIRNWSEIYIRK